MRFSGVALSLCAIAACAKPAPADREAGVVASASATPERAVVAEPAAVDAGPRRHARRGNLLEARRSSVPRAQAEPVLAANLDLLKKQFGGVLPASIGLQSTELTDDKRRAVLAFAERKDGTPESPLMMIVDDKNTVLWSRERPTAGITAPASALAIATGPEGRFAMAVCDPPTDAVALRLWDEDGYPFADFSALSTKTCDALSLLYWPGHGWVVVAAGPTETRAQLVTENGALAWGNGKLLGARWRTAAPVSLATDTPSSFVLVQYSQSPGADRDADHAVAFRYDLRGESLWPTPSDLGAVRRITPGQERIPLLRTSDGVLRATLADAQVELRSNGETRRIP